MYVEEAREVVLTASGQPLDSDHPEFSALQNEDARLLLDLMSGSFFAAPVDPVRLLSRDFAVTGSFPDDSLLSDESVAWEEVPRVSEYAEDIHRHMREREVRNLFPRFLLPV